MKQQKKYLVADVSEELGLQKEFILHCISAQWIRPHGVAEGAKTSDSTSLDEEDVARLILIRDLKQDFEANEQAISLILHLLDQIYFLRSRMIGL